MRVGSISPAGDCLYCPTKGGRPGLPAPLAFQKLKWVDEKLSKVNKANKFRAGNVQNGKL